MGLLVILVTVAASLYPRLRKVEDELPDVIHPPALSPAPCPVEESA